MNTQKRVNKMMFSSQRVELAIIDDLDKLNTTYYTSTDTVNSRIKGLLSEARATVTKLDEAIEAADKMQPIVAEVRKMAQELGVNPNNIEELQSGEGAISESAEYKQVLATINKFISSI
jgi:predicted P-loop ATPase/GTPase